MKDRIRASAIHAGISMAVAVLAYGLVFHVWYPSPFDQVTGGRNLFLILIAVDVVCGPALTAVVFNLKKHRSELIRDLSFIAVLQLTALGYGLWSTYLARPVVVGFEGDRFRVVTAAELVDEKAETPKPSTSFFASPAYMGVQLLTPDDPGYLASIRLATEGIHPSARPSRWVDFGDVSHNVASQAKSLSDLRSRYRDGQEAQSLDTASAATHLPASRLGYFPMVSRWTTDWVVIVDRQSGRVLGTAHADGW